MNNYLILFSLLMLVVPMVLAEPINISQITEPLSRIYDLLKAVVSIIGIIALTIAGARFLFAGDNIQAREGAKSMIGYAVMGLVVVWVAPLLVGYLTAS